jgi:uncharacterized membrane protein YhhN
MKTKVLSVLYFFIGLVYMFRGDNIPFSAEVVLKGLIIPWLIIILILNLRQYMNRLTMLILAGLFLSWAGDVILDFSFIPGLACFLLAHVMYLAAFFLTPGENVIFSKRKYLLIPVFLYGAALVYFLYGDLDGMRIPVILYAFVILTMLAGALNRMEKVNRISYVLVLTGAVLFVISDSAIAVNKFSYHFNYSGFVIMSTYVTAQFLITLGFIKQFREGLD